METVAVAAAAPEALAAATKIIRTAEREGIRLRLLGGLAFKAVCRSAREPEFHRENKDIDLMGRRDDTKGIMRIMETLGYNPREIFNRLNLGKRLIYYDSRNGRRVDIFLDEFEMCHKFKFKKESLAANPLTLSITDLVITKLQVVEITEKEVKDLAAAFNDFEVTDDESGINGERIAELCSGDWGVYRTFKGTLMRLKENVPLKPGSEKIYARIDQLLELIERSPKTLSWKLRARVGESFRWYELPEPDVNPS